MNTTTASPPAISNARVNRRGRFLVIASIVLLCAWILLPLYLLLLNTLSSERVIYAFPKSFVPSFDLENLKFFVNYYGVVPSVVNSVLVAAMTMIMAIAFGAPAGYALSRFQFVGKESYRVLVVMTRAFPLPLLALPLTVMFIKVGLDDTLFGLALVHTMLAIPFAVLITYSLFSGVPVELEEAAWTLGCTRFQAFRKVVLPLVLPGIAASAIFAFVISWNEVFAASILTITNKTLPAFLLTGLQESPLHLKFAGGFVLVVPALLFIFAVRKYLFAMWGIANR